MLPALVTLMLAFAPVARAEDAPQPIGDEFCLSIDGVSETVD